MADGTNPTPPAGSDRTMARVAEVAGRRTRKYSTAQLFRASQLLRCWERCALDAEADLTAIGPRALPVLALDAVGGPAR